MGDDCKTLIGFFRRCSEIQNVSITGSHTFTPNSRKHLSFHIRHPTIFNVTINPKCYPTKTMPLSPKQKASPSRANWDRSTTMLASSIMMLSISEESATQKIGFKSTLASSGNRLQGWGNQEGRTSYKFDLCSLGDFNTKSFSSQQSPSSFGSETEEEEGAEAWGFFES